MTDPTPILGTNLASAIVPFTDADQFPTHHAQYGKGGWRGVASLQDRDAIPQPRLEEGMVVFVVDIQTAYVYVNGNWQELVTGGGSGGTQTFTRLYFSNTIPELPPEGSASLELPFGKTSMILKLGVSRPVKVTVWSTPDHTDTNPYTFIATENHLIDDGSALLSDGTVLKQRNYSIFANLESPPQEKVYAVIDSVDQTDGPVSIDITYIVIESGVDQGGGSAGINIQLNDSPYDSNINTLDFSGSNWTLNNASNGLPQGTVSIAVEGGSSPAPARYVVPVTFTTGPDSDEVLRFHTFVEPVMFNPNLQGSAGYVETAPTDTYVLTVYKNGNSVGNITVHTDKSVTFQTFEILSFGIGDTMKISAPTTRDAAIENFSASLLGSLMISGSAANYVVPMSFTYTPEANEIMLFHTFVETVSFANNMSGSAGFVEIAPSQAFILNLYKNGNPIGTITVNTNKSIVFQANAVTFNIGDTLKIMAPSIADTSITDFSVSLLGSVN